VELKWVCGKILCFVYKIIQIIRCSLGIAAGPYRFNENFRDVRIGHEIPDPVPDQGRRIGEFEGCIQLTPGPNKKRAEQRTSELIIEHYRIEMGLADRYGVDTLFDQHLTGRGAHILTIDSYRCTRGKSLDPKILTLVPQAFVEQKHEQYEQNQQGVENCQIEPGGDAEKRFEDDSVLFLPVFDGLRFPSDGLALLLGHGSGNYRKGGLPCQSERIRVTNYQNKRRC
jgi:hypothetical protein